MTSNTSFIRKITYIGLIVLLLIPLAALGRPGSVRKVGNRLDKQPQGVLADMRDKLELSPAKLGDIDPASATMRLATSGMRGVAVTLLMNKAEDFKKKKEWDNLAAVLKQVSLLLPNFIAVWEHQAWNMSYNVSVEFDDYRQRYHWVKKGIDYLIEGTEYNRDEPRLLWYVGWVIGQKIGRADEHVQFRRLFRDDTEFHALLQNQQIDVQSAKGPDGKPDNWLVGRLWYVKGVDAVTEGKPLRGKSPVIFHSSPVMSRINFASALEKEVDFDEERAVSEWSESLAEWMKFGERLLPTSGGFTIHLNELEALQDQQTKLLKELDEITPGVREKLRGERMAGLKKESVVALETPADERTATQRLRVAEAEEYLKVPHTQVADRAPQQSAARARAIVNQVIAGEERARSIATSRQIVNYEYWRDRCQAESDERCARARKLMFQGNTLFKKPDLEGAMKKYEESWRNFAQIYKQWPRLMEDADTDDIVEAIELYINVLDQLDLRDESGGVLPHDFPLGFLMQRKDKGGLLKYRKKPVEEKKDEPVKEEKSEGKKSDAPTTDDAKPKAKDDAKPTVDEKSKAEEKES